jgi:hypothetical protein
MIIFLKVSENVVQVILHLLLAKLMTTTILRTLEESLNLKVNGRQPTLFLLSFLLDMPAYLAQASSGLGTTPPQHAQIFTLFRSWVRAQCDFCIELSLYIKSQL